MSIVPLRDDRIHFAVAAILFVAAAGVAAGCLPLGVSMAGVFLFAGPHNWVEARYFLGRMPGRWGKLQPFFVLSLAGTVGLPVSFVALQRVGRAGDPDGLAGSMTLAIWNSLVVVWVAALAEFRSQHNPRRAWPALWPTAFVALAAAWLAPVASSVALVYLHPLMALWILDREFARSGSQLRMAYHVVLGCVALAVICLVWHLAVVADLPAVDAVSRRIVRHAGADVCNELSSHCLVSVHAFLELTHYGVWLVAIPWFAGRSLEQVPLARRSDAWRRTLRLVSLGGAGLVVALWAGFWLDYAVTRDIYFTVALAHVFAEVPFLLRAL